MDRARTLGLDLVEVSPDSRPPVCRIMDYGKYKYELAKKDIVKVATVTTEGLGPREVYSLTEKGKELLE